MTEGNGEARSDMSMKAIVISALICSPDCTQSSVAIDGPTSFELLSPLSEKIVLYNVQPIDPVNGAAFPVPAEVSAGALIEVLSAGEVHLGRLGIDTQGATLAIVNVGGRDVGQVLMAEGFVEPRSVNDVHTVGKHFADR